MFRTIFTVIACLTFVSIVQADCPHCFKVAKVNVTFNDGKAVVGYMPLYGGDFKENDYNRLKAGNDLTALIMPASKQKGKPFFLKYYKFQGVPYLVCESEVDTIYFNNIKHLKFITWVKKFDGAGPIPTINKKYGEILKNKPIACIVKIEMPCSDRYCINTDTTISEEEIRLIFNTDRWYLTEVYCHIVPTDQTPKKLPSDIKQFINQTIKEIETNINSLNVKNKNPSVAEYFKYLRDKNNKEKECLMAVNEYIEQKNIKIINKYINSNVNNKADRIKILDTLAQSPTDIPKNIMYLVNTAYKDIVSPKIKEEMFKSVIENNDIIVLDYGWD